MKIVEYRQEIDLQNLRPVWDEVLTSATRKTIFVTWEWMSAWWSAYGAAGELRILVAYDDDGIARGIAPLRTLRKVRYGLSFQTLAFVGAGSNDSDYLDCIIAGGWEEPVVGAFWRHLKPEFERGAILELNDVPAESAGLSILLRLAKENSFLNEENETACGKVALPPTWDDYLAFLKPRFRTKVRSVLRTLESRDDVRMGFCDNREQVDELLPELFDLHTRRWSEAQKPGVFRGEQKRVFYRSVSALLLERGWLRFSRLTWKGRTLACQYGFVYDGVYSQLQEGYEPASEHWNPGIGLRAWTVRGFIGANIREYDFLAGVGRHKTDWGAEVSISKTVILAQRTPKTLLFIRGPEWNARARELAVRLAPEKLLAARRERLIRRAGGARTENAPWFRDAIAETYFRLNMSSLTRRVRDRYRLTARPGAKWPTLAKRNEGTGRILYYHRVNDDNDPFFPAISTRAFDQVMRYVSENYKVVSLTEMLDRLESGNPEQSMAITFDDGYRDNYEQAFPILQKYGLPATIFLATEPIDSRDPLWFEQLALALKKTTREFLELEIDVPRRFPTRTEAERLQANGRIYALLRDLPDIERRRWLEQILTDLGVRNDERRGKMLTWDQIRLMKAAGIDFGGHTVSHPFVSRLTPSNVTWEAAECKRRIESELQSPAHYFAYPSGRLADFQGASKELVRAAGYRAALTTIWGANRSSTDRMELRRGGPWEENPAVFAYKLDWYEFSDC